jgi:hypothetical protein
LNTATKISTLTLKRDTWPRHAEEYVEYMGTFDLSHLRLCREIQLDIRFDVAVLPPNLVHLDLTCFACLPKDKSNPNRRWNALPWASALPRPRQNLKTLILRGKWFSIFDQIFEDCASLETLILECSLRYLYSLPVTTKQSEQLKKWNLVLWPKDWSSEEMKARQAELADAKSRLLGIEVSG